MAQGAREMIKHIIAQAMWAGILYAGIAFVLGGWWSPYDWDGGDGRWARLALLLFWLWFAVGVVMPFPEKWRKK
jgi:hypothetical protein